VRSSGVRACVVLRTQASLRVPAASRVAGLLCVREPPLRPNTQTLRHEPTSRHMLRRANHSALLGGGEPIRPTQQCKQPARRAFEPGERSARRPPLRWCNYTSSAPPRRRGATSVLSVELLPRLDQWAALEKARAVAAGFHASRVRAALLTFACSDERSNPPLMAAVGADSLRSRHSAAVKNKNGVRRMAHAVSIGLRWPN